MSNDIAIRIGKNIAVARKERGRTQADIAEAVGMDTVSLSRIERGVVTAGIPTLNRIAGELNVPLRDLFDRVSANSSTLADNIMAELAPLHEEDRLFLMEQLQVWARELAKRRNK